MTDTAWLDTGDTPGTEELRTKADAVLDSLTAQAHAQQTHKKALMALEEDMAEACLLTITRHGYTIGYLSGDDEKMTIEPLDHADL